MPRRMRQVLLKLVDNALKFTDRGGVEIRVERDGRRTAVRFCVTDTGHGVPKEIAANLFKPFTPGDASYARQQQGAGLGLAVVKRIVEAAGGDDRLRERARRRRDVLVHDSGRRAPRTPRARKRRSPPPTRCPRRPACRSSSSRMTTSPTASSPIFSSRSATTSTSRVEPGRRGRAAPGAAISTRSSSPRPMPTRWRRRPAASAPILALLKGGERAPACADELLRWPPSAHELYRALGAMRERVAKDAAPEPPPPESAAAIDASAFAALEKSVGPATLLEILKSYIESAETALHARSAKPATTPTGTKPCAWRRTSPAAPAGSA